MAESDLHAINRTLKEINKTLDKLNKTMFSVGIQVAKLNQALNKEETKDAGDS